MKKGKKLYSAILVVVLMFTMSTVSLASDQTITQAHTYDVIPGTEEWENLTVEERVEASFVSEEESSKMTTEALLETILNYPYWINVYAYGNIRYGIDVVASYFPPLNEFLQREDALDVINNYLDNCPALLDGNEIDLNVYGAQSLLIKLGGTEPLTEAVTRSYDGVVLTPRKTEVDVTYDLDWAEQTIIQGQYVNYDIAEEQSELYEQIFTSAEILRDPAPDYNCHSYAWYTQATNNNCWLWDPSAYTTDGSYRSAGTAVNNRVTYTRVGTGVIEHSGIITSVSSGPAIVTSKWGPLSLFRHEVQDCPYAVGSVSVGLWARA